MSEPSSTVTGSIATERVARGLAWIKANADALGLDLDRVDPDTIQVNDGYLCPLAQAAGRPWNAVSGDAAGRSLADRELMWSDPYVTDTWAVDHGFMVMYDQPGAGTNLALTEQAWRDAIAADRQN